MDRQNIVNNSKTVVIKVGTNLLTTPEGKLDLNNLRDLTYQIADQVNNHHRKVIMITSGSITCGSERLHLTAKTIPEKQAAAAVGQILLMREYLSFFGQKGLQVGQILLTKDGLENATRSKNAVTTIKTLLKQKIIPIINENDSVATNEIKNSRFGDNDELSYLVAKLIKVDLLVTLTDIDGLYTGNPKKDSAARLISTVDANDDSVFNLIEDIPNDRSRGGMSSKLMYATKAAKMGIPVILANGRTQNSITEIFSGKEMGTLITAERFSR